MPTTDLWVSLWDLNGLSEDLGTTILCLNVRMSVMLLLIKPQEPCLKLGGVILCASPSPGAPLTAPRWKREMGSGCWDEGRWHWWCGSVMGWNAARLNLLPGIITYTLVSASPKSCHAVEAFLLSSVLASRPSCSLYQLHWPEKPQSQRDPSSVLLLWLLSNGLRCTHSYSHALSWSVCV